VIRESGANQGGDRPFFDFLESCLRNKAEMVILEAARAITELNGVTSRELTPAITVLQLFLSSSKPVLRFAAVRTLNKVGLLAKCIYAIVVNMFGFLLFFITKP
jgi:coatomer subunit gamma